MSRYSIAEFVSSTSQKERGEGLFELESERMLEVNLSGLVWTKMGSMVAYKGDIKFTREGVLEHGLGRLLKKSFTGEGVRLTKAEGGGSLYLADKGKKVLPALAMPANKKKDPRYAGIYRDMPGYSGI